MKSNGCRSHTLFLLYLEIRIQNLQLKEKNVDFIVDDILNSKLRENEFEIYNFLILLNKCFTCILCQKSNLKLYHEEKYLDKDHFDRNSLVLILGIYIHMILL
jgi:hypothetical protein